MTRTGRVPARLPGAAWARAVPSGYLAGKFSTGTRFARPRIHRLSRYFSCGTQVLRVTCRSLIASLSSRSLAVRSLVAIKLPVHRPYQIRRQLRAVSP